MKKIAVLGSTGSIGTQTLDIIQSNPDRFELYAITGYRNVSLLISQARQFHPEVVCIADESLYDTLREALADLDIKVWSGAESIVELVTFEGIDIVVAAMVGYAGLKPTIAAIKAGKTIALANKETLVVAGDLIASLALKHHAAILPVDSEHSAIFQSLIGESSDTIEKLILTASGGPFLRCSMDEIARATAAQALKHPNWEMGAKITIDSASMMNKGFEVIEAKWLFDIDVDHIEVLVHPESIVHSAIQYIDGSVKAQLGIPDMHLPIQYALSFPERIYSQQPRLDLSQVGMLHFEKPDLERFPNLLMAYQACRRGGNMPCILNAANEVVNLAFRENKCGFLEMSHIISKTMDCATFVAYPDYEDYVQSDLEARRIAQSMIK